MLRILKDSFDPSIETLPANTKKDRECLILCLFFLVHILLYSLGEHPIYRLNSEEK